MGLILYLARLALKPLKKIPEYPMTENKKYPRA